MLAMHQPAPAACTLLANHYCPALWCSPCQPLTLVQPLPATLTLQGLLQLQESLRRYVQRYWTSESGSHAPSR